MSIRDCFVYVVLRWNQACKEQIDALNKCLQGYGFNIPAAK